MKYLIWSFEHRAYWAAERKGYVVSRCDAGRYEHDEAAKVCQSANRFINDKDAPQESMIPDL